MAWCSTFQRTSVDKKKSRQEVTRDRIVECAAELFTAKGYSATSLKDIADALNLTRTAMYYYFDSKEDVLHALVEEDAQVAASLLHDIRVHRDGTVLQRFRQSVEVFVGWVLRRRNIFILIEGIGRQFPSEITSIQQNAKRQVLQEFIDLISEGIDSGDFSTTDPRSAALAIIGMCNWSAWWFNGEDEGINAVAQFMSSFAVKALVTETLELGELTTGDEISRPGGNTDLRGAQGAELSHTFRRVKNEMASLERVVTELTKSES